MKKYLYSALALPLLFACSAEDLPEKKVLGNDQFAGIEKVDATFSMDEGAKTRMATEWSLEEGDRYGFAWLTDNYDGFTGTVKVPLTGDAFQNHPLDQTGSIFKPATSIYVGKYFLYRPYDETVVSPSVINFSLANQPLANDVSEKHNGAPYQALAASAIIIGDKWTDVTPTGHGKLGSTLTWDKAGIDQHYDIYAALFSNRTALDLTYLNNNPKFKSETTISGATDINFKIAENAEVGAVDISKVTVDLQRTGSISAATFTYGPTKEPANGAAHKGNFWENVSNIPGITTFDGFGFTNGAITLENEDKTNINTGAEGSKGWIWFNSLPVTNGDAALTDKVVTTYETTFGTVTINDKDGADTEVTLQNVAFARETPTTGTAKEWIKFGAADDETQAKDKKVWTITAADHNTFVNQYGNHVGKYALTVDFSKGVMDGMHIKDDASLQKALKYYIASGKTENVVLNLDELNSDNSVFEISKISIALIQTINATTSLGTVKVQACTTHGTPKIIVTQDGQTGELAGKTEVPALNNVFAAPTDVYLAEKTNWTWSGGGETAGWDDAVTIDANVKSITNEGTITVEAKNIQLSVSGVFLYNASDATMNINKVTTVKNHLNNFGTINVGSSTNKKAELRAYNAKIYNNATDLNAQGVINNYGVVGSTSGTTGEFHNWGLIIMKNDDAMTLLKSNEKGTKPFGSKFDKTTNKMGKVVLPKDNPTAIVSVANTAENGFIEYDWTDATYATPAGNVKYNTIVVSNNITFTEDEKEIQYIRFTGVRKQVVNPVGNLTELKGIIVDNEDGNASIIIEKNNEINCSVGAFLGEGATVYLGGAFTYPAGATTNYLGTWSTDQIVEWGK